MVRVSARVPAPAKVNLFLHVGTARDDGRHPLDSLVMFADEQACDWLTFSPADQISLSVTGPGAVASGAGEENLVLRAFRAVLEARPDLAPHAMTLDKALPVAAGLGGGSADAGAVLRVLGSATGVPDDALLAIAARLGGDVPACVLAKACRMAGDGDRVTPLSGVAALPALLVNPKIPCPTGPVFRQFDGLGLGAGFSEIDLTPITGIDPPALIQWLRANTRNDLEAAAIARVPAIARVLEALSQLPGARLVRMSGSGASCFVLFDTLDSTRLSHEELFRLQPNWWARPVLLR